MRSANVGSASECGDLCAAQSGCLSFTYGKKPGQWYSKICFLKKALQPGRKEHDCCDSGYPCQAKSVPPVPVPASICVEPNIDYRGGKQWRVQAVSSAEMCQILCAKEPLCKSFTYDARGSNACYLKGSEKPGRMELAGVISGLPCTASASNCMEPNIDYRGGTLSLVRDVSSAEICRLLCAKNHLCKSFTYDARGSNNACYLKASEKPGRMDFAGVISGLPCILRFKITGKSGGKERVTIHVGSEIQSYTVSEEGTIFEFPWPVSGAFSVTPIWDNRPKRWTVLFEAITPENIHIESPKLWKVWNCGSPTENVACDSVRKGTFTWGETYVLVIQGP